MDLEIAAACGNRIDGRRVAVDIHDKDRGPHWITGIGVNVEEVTVHASTGFATVFGAAEEKHRSEIHLVAANAFQSPSAHELDKIKRRDWRARTRRNARHVSAGNGGDDRAVKMEVQLMSNIRPGSPIAGGGRAARKNIAAEAVDWLAS